MNEVVIVSAKRTPSGKFGGFFKNISAIELGSQTLKSAILDSKLDVNEIKYCIIGNVLQTGLKQNPARQVALKSGFPITSTAFTINEVCGSGLKAIILGYQSILLNTHKVVACGGIENMSRAPFFDSINRFEEDKKITSRHDSIYYDALTDAFTNKLMGQTIEALIIKYNITRIQQDLFALNSHNNASFASVNGFFKQEITPIKVDNNWITSDETIRQNSSIEKLATLNPIYPNGTITAGNASSLNDGASMLILMDKKYAQDNNIKYLATIKNISEIGTKPELMGIAPIESILLLLKKAKLNITDIDLFEINESFASQTLIVKNQLNIPDHKLNISGGAIALGHPIGASGARIVTSLIHNLNRTKKRYGIASLCVGGGIGLSILIEGNNYE